MDEHAEMINKLLTDYEKGIRMQYEDKAHCYSPPTAEALAEYFNQEVEKSYNSGHAKGMELSIANRTSVTYRQGYEIGASDMAEYLWEALYGMELDKKWYYEQVESFMNK